MDWVPLAYELGVSSAAVASIKERGLNGAQQAALMLQLWRSQGENKALGIYQKNDNKIIVKSN